MEEVIERLRAIIESGNVTSEDKQLIVDLSLKYQLDFKPKKGCDGRYQDQALLVYNAIKAEEGGEQKCKARLRDDIDVVINGYRINNATLTDELVEKYRGKGLPEHWFV